MRNTPDFHSTLPTTFSGRTRHDLRPRSSSHSLACCETGVWIQLSPSCLLLVGDVGSWCHAAVEREALKSEGGVERLGRAPWRIGNREMASARRQQASLLTIPPRPRLLVLAAPGAMLPWGWLVKPNRAGQLNRERTCLWHRPPYDLGVLLPGQVTAMLLLVRLGPVLNRAAHTKASAVPDCG